MGDVCWPENTHRDSYIRVEIYKITKVVSQKLSENTSFRSTEDRSYGPKVWVPPNSNVEILTPKMIVLGGLAFGK